MKRIDETGPAQLSHLLDTGPPTVDPSDEGMEKVLLQVRSGS